MTIEEMPPQLHRRSRKTRKPMKRWKKWLLFILIGLFVLAVAAIGLGYWYIHSISLDDIRSRHQTADTTAATPSEPVKIPAILEGTVDKAAGLVGKDIEGQDALDVAAILLNSGLSLKEIRYLQGNATYDLSTEEKQQIRDLLLKKLTSEEIELLRAITSKYGKYLSILNPEYPIEWVGERDPELIKEHERQWAEMQDAKETDVEGNGPNSSTAQTSKEKDQPAQPTARLTTKQSAAKQKIDAKFNGQLASLKSSCTAKSNDLLQTILKDVAADPDISLSKLQTKFIGQLADAESACDTQFNELLAKAQTEYTDAGIPVTFMPDWKSDYSKAKSAARGAGIAAIANKLNAK